MKKRRIYRGRSPNFMPERHDIRDKHRLKHRRPSPQRSDAKAKPRSQRAATRPNEVIGQPLSLKTISRRGKILRRTGIISASLLLLMGLSLYVVWRSMMGQVTLVDPDQETLPFEFDFPTESLVNPVPSEKGVTNILLLGVDTRDPGNIDGRSDSMMILTLNEKQGQIKLTSLQRDMLVYLPGRDLPDKINAANVHGGPALAMRVVNDTFRLDIQNYAVVNMSGMEEIIDIAGGVMIDVLPEEVRLIRRVQSSGLQRLDGKQAVDYARIRKIDSDYVRMQRQRVVMQALLDAFNEADLIRKGQMINEGLSWITTNLRAGEITDLGLRLLPNMSRTIEQMQLPIEGHFIEESRARWVIRADFNSMIPKLQEFIWGRTFPFDPVKEIPGAPNSSKPLPTLAPRETTQAPPESPSPTPPQVSPTPPAVTPTPPAVTPTESTTETAGTTTSSTTSEKTTETTTVAETTTASETTNSETTATTTAGTTPETESDELGDPQSDDAAA